MLDEEGEEEIHLTQDEIPVKNKGDEESSDDKEGDEESDQSSENEDIDESRKHWRSTLISSGMGSFLDGRSLQEKVKLAMARQGLTSADPDTYGAVIDTSEFLVRQLVSSLITKARTRMQEAQPNMGEAKPGSTVEVQTQIYYQENPRAKGKLIFEPKTSNPFTLLCTGN